MVYASVGKKCRLADVGSTPVFSKILVCMPDGKNPRGQGGEQKYVSKTQKHYYSAFVRAKVL